MLLLLFPNFFFQFLLYRPIFFLIILLERKFLPVYDTFVSFSYPGFVIWEHFYVFCGIARSIQNSTYPHTDSFSSLISLAESTNTSQSECLHGDIYVPTQGHLKGNNGDG